MVGSPTSVGDVLSLIGNSPVLHASQSAVENLRHAKSTFPMFGGGDMSSMMSQMMSNPGSILSSAMGSITGQLGGMLSGMQGQLQSLIGGGSLGTGLLSSIGTADPVAMLTSLTGVGGLQPALSSLNALAGTYAGPLGLLTLNAAYSASQAMPDVINVDDVMGPMILGPTTAGLIQAGLVGTVSSGDVPGVNDYTAQLLAIIAAHNAAMSAASSAAMAIAGVGLITYALSAPGPFGDAVNAMLSADARDTAMAHLEAVSGMIASAKAKAANPLSNAGATV